MDSEILLAVPALRQPDATACLPTCVEAVLLFLGYAVTHREVYGWCHATPSGSDSDMAVQGLMDHGFDAELLQVDSLDTLAEYVEEGRPPIVVLVQPGGGIHAVVVCGLTREGVSVMDPAFGRLMTIPQHDFLQAWRRLDGESLLVGAAPERQG